MNEEGTVIYLQTTPVHLVSRLHAELVCFEAGMDMNKLMFLRLYKDVIEPISTCSTPALIEA